MSTTTTLVHEVSCSLGKDVLQLYRMVADENLGHPFCYELELMSEKHELDADKLLGAPLTVTLNRGENKRYFHGLVSRFVQLGQFGSYSRYRATLRPWLWFLSKTYNCRIFQEMTVPDILKKLFKEENGFSDFKVSLSGTYPKLDYCVQYRESDFTFASRLMEQQGIYYYFDHKENKHELVLADSYSAHSPIEGGPKVPFRAPGEGTVELEHISHWTLDQEVQSGACVIDDFDFEKPRAELQVQSKVKRKHAQSSFEVYDFPGKYLVTKDGESYAKTRIEAWQAQHKRVEARGDASGLACGGLVTLEDHPRDDQNAEHLIVGTHIEIVSGEIDQFGSDRQNKFDVRFTAIESKQPYRTLPETPKPVVPGPQSAIVVGKKGEEIWTDKYGRVKVQFHWDRKGKSDENSSCWVRVAQAWAGKNWGAIQIPRIGQEVLIEFLDGDPDRPIVTGRVYNADQMPPYQLPDKQTQSGLKTRSTKEGTAENANELRFDDKKGEESIYFHAEKDFERVVENNDSLKVGFEKKDKGDQTVEIFNNQTLKVGCKDASDGSQTIEIWKNRTETVKEGDEKVTIAKGKREVFIDEGDEKLQVKKGKREVLVDTGDDTHTIAKGNRTVEVSAGNDTLTIKQGNQTIKISSGKSVIEAGTSIELKVGGSSLKIEPSKITLKSSEIAIQGEGKIDAKAPMINVTADGKLVLKGGMVNIN